MARKAVIAKLRVTQTKEARTASGDVRFLVVHAQPLVSGSFRRSYVQHNARKLCYPFELRILRRFLSGQKNLESPCSHHGELTSVVSFQVLSLVPVMEFSLGTCKGHRSS